MTLNSRLFVEVPGARIVGQTQITARTIVLTLATPSFATPTMVEVTLPALYDADAGRNWPVTYYLAGTNHNHASFRALYHGERLTASYPSIVVSPKGDAGYWSDWFQAGAAGPRMYETFVTSQLIPLIDANFRTIANRSHRAIMGESMGGYGVMMLAARHPDLFVAAASLSGGPDTNFRRGTLFANLSSMVMGAAPGAIYGKRRAEEVRWRGHNPVDLAANLRDVQLQVRTGNGAISRPDGENLGDLFGSLLEKGIILPESISFHNRLEALAIAHVWQRYAWGCHSVPHFGQQIGDTLPGFLAAFGTPAPSSFDYRSVEPAFSVYGWSVVADPARALEFLELAGVGRQGLTLSGSGTTVVTTPPLFAASRPVTVVVNGAASSVTASLAGRITFPVNLGAANVQQQYRRGSVTAVTGATVTLAD
jgi:S-formylglutathione hydrolase FrmB